MTGRDISCFLENEQSSSEQSRLLPRVDSQCNGETNIAKPFCTSWKEAHGWNGTQFVLDQLWKFKHSVGGVGGALNSPLSLSYSKNKPCQ